MTQDQFSFRPNGNGSGLTIDVHVAVVIVLHKYRGKWLELYEDRQVFSNGEILRRSNYNGIAETLKRGETFKAGAHRCLSEELKFRDPTKYTIYDVVEKENRDPVPSEKWPGIKAAYHRYVLRCEIEREIFFKDGYLEIEDNRTIYFKWKPYGQLLMLP